MVAFNAILRDLGETAPKATLLLVVRGGGQPGGRDEIAAEMRNISLVPQPVENNE